LQVAPDYVTHAFPQWERSLNAGGCATRQIELTSRLLVGHGNGSAAEVGLTVHHTWGVPMIPGSALKGLCAHYTAATYGPLRPKFAGPKWEKDPRRIADPPGDYYRALFGAPDVSNDASAGLVVFHDALYVPDSTAGDRPFAVDVLTLHQRSYYGQDRKRGGIAGQHWPNDYDSPNPVGFISVRPGVKLLLGVDGDPKWAGLALDLLTEAIRAWGAGGKTSAGYGRGR
jgi:CRISPR-associated protein Cmr6